MLFDSLGSSGGRLIINRNLGKQFWTNFRENSSSKKEDVRFAVLPCNFIVYEVYLDLGKGGNFA